MQFRNLFAGVCVLLILGACKKNTSSANNDMLVLQPLKISGNTATLDWTSSINPNTITGFTVCRSMSGGYQVTYNVDNHTTHFTDTLPFAPDVTYSIIANCQSAPGHVVSNSRSYDRTDVAFIKITPKDALYDKTGHQIFITSAQNIIQYDLTSGKVINQITSQGPAYTVAPTMGNCDMGVYNNQKELYVPRSDGWLYVYDANTLIKVDQIYIRSQEANCVVNNDGILYVSIVDTSGNNVIASYNRATKQLISTVSLGVNTYQSEVYITLLPGSNAQFYGLSYNAYYYFSFDSTGKYISRQKVAYVNNTIANTYQYTPSFAVAPNGFAISNSSAQIINKNLSLVSSLPADTAHQADYSCFDFDNTNNLVYAGYSSEQMIRAFSISNDKLVKTIDTRGYPVKIFYDNGTVYSVSNFSSSALSFPYVNSGYAFVEQFN